MSNEGNIYLEVQATLLSSECSPEYAVERALQAVADFAVAELDLDDRRLLELASAAFVRSVY